MRVRFITSTPLNIEQGSGTFVGIRALAKSLADLGVEVEFSTPGTLIPIYTLRRLVFNRLLPLQKLLPVDVTVGFDMDGYTLAGTAGPHVAALKGVIADEMRFESGLTRATMAIQAKREKLHVQRAGLVIATSQYSSRKIQELYGVATAPHIVPELIDLSRWNKLFETEPAPSGKFTVLSVCRFYPRKRLEILLAAGGLLRSRIPQLQIRLIGDGPERARLAKICRDEKLEDVVVWRQDLSQAELAGEYQQCHVFCLPSEQEGFGVVLLEAMACGKPIVAARAGAIPEVASHALLVEPNDARALADAIGAIYRNPDLGKKVAGEGQSLVKSYDTKIVARQFLAELELARMLS